jgi:hypothetical protein
MELFWKDIKIKPGMTLEVEEFNDAASNEPGKPVRVRWKIIDIKPNPHQHAYYEVGTGKTYTLESVMKKRKLFKKHSSGELIQIPPSSDFLVVQRYHDGDAAGKHCYSVDLLSHIRNVKIAD